MENVELLAMLLSIPASLITIASVIRRRRS